MHTTTTPNLSYGINKACEITGLGRSFLYQQIAKGDLPIFKVGTRTLISAEDLNTWLDSFKKTSS